MSRRITRRRLLLAACSLAASGCAARPASTPTLPALGESLRRALGAGDEAGFLAGFADTDHGRALGRRIYANLRQLDSVDLRTSSIEAGPPSVVTIAATWALGRGARTATSGLRFALADGDPARIDSAQVRPRQPLWTQADLVVRGADAVTLELDETLAAQSDVWLTAGATAIGAVGGDALGELTAGWDGRLAVELPALQRDYALLVGMPTEEAIGTGGVTLRLGESPESPLRVVVNPRVGIHAGADAAAAVLVHEAVHVATNSIASPAPLWLKEGLAESVAAATVPSAGTANRAKVQAWVGVHGFPTALPGDADFRDDPASAYALAQFAVDALIAHRGRAETLRSAATGEVPAEALAWYQEAARG